MKKLFRNLSVLLLATVAVLTTGCYEQDVPFLTVDHEVVLVGPATDKGTVVVESNLEWTASSDCEWIAIDNGFGNHKGTFEFFVEANTTPYERSGKIKLEGAGCAVTILVRQQSEGTLLTLAADEIAFTKLAGEYLMSICCNNGWTASSSADWCKVDPTSGNGNGSFKISVDENATGSDRMATISIVTEADGKTQVSKVNVFQSASNDAMVVSPESKQLTEAAEDFVIDLVTVGNWSASVDSDWLTLGQTSGKGDAKVVVSASANETGAVRQAVITFATGKENENRVIRQVVVTQEAFDFYLELPIQDFPLSLAAQDIEIPYNLAGSNVTVSASSNVDWMKVTSVADGKAVVAVNENKTSKAREGVIAFITNGQNGEPIIRQARVAQAPTINLLDVLASEYAIEWIGDVVLIPIYSNTPVSARSSESWCHVSVKDQDVVISVDRNDTALPREAVVTVRTESESGDILSKTTIIRQAAAYSELVVSPATKMVFALEETFVGSIVTNNSWTASVDSPWLTIDKTEGTGDYMLTITAEANTTGQQRVATITVETGIENSKRESATIVVTQVPEQFYFEIPGRAYALTKYAQQLQIPFQTSGNELEVVATTSEKWITIDAVDQEANIIYLSVDMNGTEFVRTGVVSVSCTPQYGDPEVIDVTITQSPTVNILDIFIDSVDVMAKGDTLSLPFYANVPVQITTSESWVHVNQYEYPECCANTAQQLVTIKVDPNRTAEPRVAFVTLTNTTNTGEKLTRVITIRQAALQAALEVTPKTVIKPAFASEFDIKILSTGTWSVTCDESWITLSDAYGFADGSVHVSMPVNDSGADRTATITIATGAENETREIQKVTVTQLMKDTYLIIPEEAYALNKWEQGLNVGYYVAGELTDMQVNCSEDWITYDPANSDETTLAFKVKENDTKDIRTATVTVTATFLQGDPITDTFIVTQAPTVNILDVFVDKKFVVGAGEHFTLPYYCNTDANVTSSVPWMTVTLDDANDPQAINVVVATNHTAEARKGYITITNINEKGEKLTKIIEVEQAPLQASLMVTPETQVLPAHDAEFVAGINCTGKWAINCDAAWLTLSATEGEGDAEITVTAEDNETGAERVATITVTTDAENGERVTKDIVVKQIPFDLYLDIPEDAYALNKYEQTLDVAYTKAGSISDFFVEVSEDWITFDSEDGKNLTFKVAENTTAEVRKATVTATVVPVKGEPITDTFTVTQAPTVNILDIFQDYIAVLAEGEEVVLPLLTNTTIDAVVSNAAWVSAVTDDDRITITAAENTTGLDRTATVTVTTTTDKGQTIKKVITVFQPAEGMYFDVITPLSYMLSKEEQVVPTMIYAATGADNGEIEAKSDSEWIVLSNVEPNGNVCNVEFTVAENTTDQIRVGHVVVTYTDQKGETHNQTITYTQAPTINTLDAFADYMVVEPEGETETVAIMTNDAAISAVSSDAWVKVSATTDLVTITADENETGVDRQARVTISTTNSKGNMVKKVITVFQPAEKAYFKLLTSNEFNLSKDEQGIDAVVYAATGTDNGEVDQNTDVDWITITGVDVQPNTCKVSYTVAENTTGKARTGHINVTFTDQKGETFVETITVNQAATVNTLDALADYLAVAAEGETSVVPILTNTTVEAVASAPWLHVSADANGVTITADENNTGLDREGLVTVATTNANGDVVKKVITVFQPAKETYFDVLTAKTYYVNKEGQTIKTVIYAATGADNGEIQADPDCSWITLASVDAADELCNVEFAIAENTTAAERTGHVVVTYTDQKGETHTETITYVQAATVNTLDAFADYIVVEPEGETEKVAVVTNDAALAVTTSDAWLSATATTSEVSITAAENKSGVDRQGTVTIKTTNTKGDVITKVVTVYQPAEEAYFELLTENVFNLSKEAQDVDAVVYAATGTNNNEISENTDCSWITISAVDPQATTCKITYTVAENTTGAARTGHINVIYTDQKGEAHVETITVNQAATVNSLDAFADYIVLEAAGETETVAVVTNDSALSAVASDAWLSASATTSAVTITAAANESGVAREGRVTISTTSDKGEKVTKVVTVYQPAEESYVELLTEDVYNLTKDAQDIEAVVYAATGTNNGEVNQNTDCSWITLSNVDPKDNTCALTYTVAENTTGASRTGHVKVIYKDQKGESHVYTITVNQAPTVNVLDAVADYIILEAAGETEKVAVVTNDATLSVVASDAWISASATTSAVSITAPKNTTGYDRQGTVTVSTTSAKGEKVTKVITVFQPAQDSFYGLLTPAEYYVAKEGATISVIGYASTGQAYAFSENRDADWISAPALGAYTETEFPVTYTIAANNTAEERTGTINILFTDQKGEVHVMPVTVHQAATVNTLDVLNDYIVVAAKGEAQNFAVVSNGNVKVTENATWFTATEANGIVTVTADENTTGLDREAVVIVETSNANGNKVKKEVTVFQPAKAQYFKLVTADNYTVDNATYAPEIVAYVANGATAENVTFKSNCDWITIGAVTTADQTASTTATIAANATSEARFGQIDVTYTDEKGEAHKEVITVKQSGTEISFESLASNLVLSPLGETFDMVVVSDAEINAVSSDPTWLTATVTPGTGISTVSITATENNTGYDRSGVVTVYTTVGGKQFQQTITVSQPAKDTNFDILTAKTYYVAKEGATLETIAYASTGANGGEIKAEPDCSWITLAGVTTTETTCQPVFTVAENTTAEERTGHVVVTYTDKKGAVHTETITYIQAGTVNTLDVLSDYVVVAAKGDTQDFAIVANGTVSVTENADWFTATESNGVVTIVADVNKTGYAREAVITVTTTNTKGNKVTKNVTVHQPADDNFYGLLTSDEFFLNKEAQTINATIYASAGADNNEIDQNVDVDWITLGAVTADPTTCSINYNVAANTTGASRTGHINVVYKDQKGEQHVETVTVHQTAEVESFNADPEYLVLDPKGEEYTLMVESSNALQQAVPSASWLSATLDGTKATIKAAENTTGKNRSGRVTLVTTVNGKQVQKVINVTQPAKATQFMLISSPSVAFTQAESNFNVVVYSLGFEPVKAETAASWLTVPASGSASDGVYTFACTAEENLTKEPRTAEINVYGVDAAGNAVSAVVTVAQSPTENVLDLYTDKLVILQPGKTIDLPMYASFESPIVKSNEDWLTASLAVVDGVQYVRVTAPENENEGERIAIVTIKCVVAPGNVQQKNITIVQQGKGDEPIKLGDKLSISGKWFDPSTDI